MKLERAGGILVHPTSFPSRYGIGDLGPGAYDFLNFACQSGVKLWQILPFGPTGFGDSPYQSFSTFAGNPLLISPDVLVADGLLNAAETVLDISPFDPRTVDYGAVNDFKTRLFKKAFNHKLINIAGKEKNDFEDFCCKNQCWLDDYALFVALKRHFIEKRRFEYESEEYNAYRLENLEFLSENTTKDCYYGAAWTSWPKDIKNRSSAALLKWRERLAEDIRYHQFVQYLFFKQWRALKTAANNRGIAIIGDIPIFVAMDSADVWANPELFCLDENGYPTAVAGVPPDYFSAAGQLWGNPLYKWSAHRQTGYHWWIERTAHALEVADMLRIDHFRGFDACWAVPYGEETAVNGQWEPGPGKELFEHIRAAFGDLPIIAEDLGVITESVEALRDMLNLPGMKILQFGMEDSPASKYLPHNYATAHAVVYTGTHDNDTTRGWYEKVNEGTKTFFKRYIHASGDGPAWDLIRLAFSSIAAFAVIPIQDIFDLGSEGRMNTPGTAAGNWKFRYTADMLSPQLAERLNGLIRLFNR